MEIRIFELHEKLNSILDEISAYCNRHGFVTNINGLDYIEEDVPFEFELRNNPNKRRSVGVAKFRRNTGYILLSSLSTQMFWYVAWLAYRIKNNQDVENTEFIIRQLIVVDKGEENAPLNQLPEWDSNELDDIFCYAMAGLICHELGHAVLNHPGYYDEKDNLRDPEMLKRNEFAADSFAARCILEISGNDELAKYGLLVNQLALLFTRNKYIEYTTHPEPVPRLNNIRNFFDFSGQMQAFVGFANGLSEEYLKERFV